MLLTKLKLSLLVSLLFFILTGCSVIQKFSATDVDVLKERAELRWQALIKKDWDAAYAFELPAYRKTHDLSQYRAKFGVKVQWKSIAINDAIVMQLDKVADVKLNLIYRVALAGGDPVDSDSDITERWLKQEGEWWIAN